MSALEDFEDSFSAMIGWYVLAENVESSLERPIAAAIHRGAEKEALSRRGGDEAEDLSDLF